MSIEKVNLKKQMEEALSTRFGGSLLFEKTKLDQTPVTVFIGLGGLGGRAVNAIKGTTKEKLNNEDKRFFLVVDTCRKDMNKISVATAQDIKENDTQEETRTHGFIEAEEKMVLYSDPFKIGALGHDVDEWLDREAFKDRTVDDLGAQGIRQIGRVMLLGKPDSYAARCTTVKNLLMTAQAKAAAEGVPMRIYIISGIGGGTGSGTIVDFAYMVRKAIATFPLDHKRVEGVLFTPDVQKNDSGMSEEYYNSLCVNFYAAIKEIDYFFNNKARNKSYKCPIGVDSDVYKEDIFDQCTLISSCAGGISMARNSDELVLKFANAITFELSGIQGVSPDGSTQSYDAFYSNINTQFRYWYRNNSNGQGLDVPDFFPHRYSSVGYSSFYIPRDEITAYCANMLIERMVKDWTEKDIKDNEIKNELRKYGLISNRAFASKLFDLSNCADKFDAVDRKELPKDGLGLLPVQNCASYLELMKEIATSESRTHVINQLIGIAENRIPDVIVKPIISTVDKAFTSSKGRGPVYAINLLSANQYNRKGFLPQIAELIGAINADATAWGLELQQTYAQLSDLATQYDGKLSIDPGDLNTFADSCRQYGEDLLKVALLKQAHDVLVKIHNSLNDENHRMFEIYTTTFEFLKDILKKDGEYVLNTNRHRDGHTTVFTFDVADFQSNDVKSQRFKTFFKQFVDNEDVEKHATVFINDVLGGLKAQLAPVDGTPVEFTEKDVIDILRAYFNTSFSSWADDVIEKFCVLAYSTIEVSPSTLTEVFHDDKLKGVALQDAADAIETKISGQKGVLLTSADPSRDVEGFASYTAFYGLTATPDINALFNRVPSTMVGCNWSEFIGYKRIFGFPLSLLAELKNYKKLYDEQKTARGMHLDEVGDDWRYALPEPFDYNISKLLKLYERGGNDVTENDFIRKKKILNTVKAAKDLGILILSADGGADIQNADTDLLYYRLIPGLLKSINVKEKHNEIYNAFKAKLLENPEESFTLTSLLEKTGYALGEAVDIKWQFTLAEYSVMKNRADFGDDNVFGNFITLIRSNYEWETKLENAVALFTELQEIYDQAVGELNEAKSYDEKIISFMRAIRVGRIIPFYNEGVFTGYKIKVNNNAEDDVVFVNSGLDVLDKKYLLYNFFTESYLKLSGSKYTAMCTLVERAFTERVDFSADSCKNVRWFIDEAIGVINDGEYLAHYDEATMISNFKSGLKYSKFEYSLPSPSNGKENVNAIVSNLKGFYVQVRDYLTNNLPKEAVGSSAPTNNTQASTSKPISANEGNWTCDCGTVNTGKFCMNCGKPQPVKAVAGAWICGNCGKENTGNFCSGCGNKKPADNGSWICSCGTVNTGNFCSKCGNKKPADNGSWTCSCGTVNTGNFCSKCGNKKSADDGRWTCSCGTVNTGNFCSKCGNKKSADDGRWTCSCGTVNTGGFCSNCGSKKN